MRQSRVVVRYTPSVWSGKRAGVALGRHKSEHKRARDLTGQARPALVFADVRILPLGRFAGAGQEQG